jgi:GT2 family glycosyltransferase
MAVSSPAPVRLRPRLATVPATGAPPLVSVIIVNYRRWDETAALVRQLVAEDHLFRDRIEVCVVDNASPRSPLETVIQEHFHVPICRLPENRGFSAGVNAGVAMSRGHWVLVLNPDLVVCNGFVDLMCAAAVDCDEDISNGAPVGVVGFQLRNRDGTHQLSTGFYPTLTKMVLGLLRPRTQRKYFVPLENRRQSVSWVTGSCLLVRRTCMGQIGGFDEDFFLYYEDVDLCRRAQEQGWAICYEPAVKAVHLDPLQNRPLTETMRAITRHASLTYFRKHLSSWQFRGLAQIIRAEAWGRQLWAKLSGRTLDAAICRQVRSVCRDMVRGRPTQARQRLEEVLQIAGMR